MDKRAQEEWPAKTKWTEPELAVISSFVNKANIKALAKGVGNLDKHEHIHDEKSDRRYIYRLDPDQGQIKGVYEVLRPKKEGQPPIFQPLDPVKDQHPMQEKQAFFAGDVTKRMFGQRMQPFDTKTYALGQIQKERLARDKSWVPGSRQYEKMQFERKLGKGLEEHQEGGVGGGERQRRLIQKRTTEQRL